jgi:hypothetical protein
MKLPKSWNDILVDQYIELRGLEAVPSDSFIDKDIETLSIVTDTDIDELEDLTLSQVGEYTKQLTWIRREPTKKIIQTLDNLHYKGMNFTLGEYIELNYLFSVDFVENLPLICAVMFRQKDVDKWGEEIIESYAYDPNTRKNLFLELPITSVYGIITEFLEYKKNFEKTYENLFQEDYSDEPEAEEIDKKEQAEEERQNKWSWERLVYEMCNGDLTKRDEALSLDLVFVFNMLAMKKDLNLE